MEIINNQNDIPNLNIEKEAQQCISKESSSSSNVILNELKNDSVFEEYIDLSNKCNNTLNNIDIVKINKPYPPSKYKSKNAFGDNLRSRSIAGQKREVGSEMAIIELIKTELEEKQIIIERLMEDINIKTQSISAYSNEIKSLREENNHVQLLIKDKDIILQQKKNDDIESEKIVESSLPLETLSRSVIYNVIIQLGESLKLVEHDRIELKRLMSEADSSQLQLKEQKKLCDELNTAHSEQLNYMNKLKITEKKLETYRSTIERQEMVIAKMQSLLQEYLIDAQEKDARGSTININKDTILEKILENVGKKHDIKIQERLKNSPVYIAEQKRIEDEKIKKISQEKELVLLNNQIENLNNKLVRLENSDPLDEIEERNILTSRSTMSDDYGFNNDKSAVNEYSNDTDCEVDMPANVHKLSLLNIDITTTSYRIEALEEQLKDSSQESSREIAKLKMKIFEFEMMAAMSNTGEDLEDDFEDYDDDGIDDNLQEEEDDDDDDDEEGDEEYCDDNEEEGVEEYCDDEEGDGDDDGEIEIEDGLEEAKSDNDDEQYDQHQNDETFITSTNVQDNNYDSNDNIAIDKQPIGSASKAASYLRQTIEKSIESNDNQNSDK
jgi:hypothetical protein